MTWPNGDEYYGEWKSEQMNGRGGVSTSLNDGRVYHGMFKGGKKHGTVRSCRFMILVLVLQEKDREVPIQGICSRLVQSLL
jgi:hypothetical protein